MVSLCEYAHCTGCSACHDACANQAISMVPDKYGFLVPKVDESKCVNCALCTRVCPSLNELESNYPVSILAAKANDDGLRRMSSSGGIFTLIAKKILEQGGEIFGAELDMPECVVRHSRVCDESGLAHLRGSKYVQSRTDGIYAAVERSLIDGKKVLFTGTPCQTTALKRFLSVRHKCCNHINNLFLVDVVCHGTPSPQVFKKYIAWNEGIAHSKVVQVSFRDKTYGWKLFSMNLQLQNNSHIIRSLTEDAYMKAFLNELCSRSSCYNCRFRNFNSQSDLTIADYWRVEECIKEIADDVGVSLVLVKTERGAKMINAIADSAMIVKSCIEQAIVGNSALIKNPNPNPKRKWFLTHCSSSDFPHIVEKALERNFLRKALSRVVRLVNKIKV